MTITDLRDCLFEIRDQDQEIDIDDIASIMGLWNRYKSIDSKIDHLIDEEISFKFISGWQRERADTLNEIRNYKGSQNKK